jgi:hypothetical protein
MAGVTIDRASSRRLTLTELSDELKALWRGVFGAAVNVADRSRNGQLIQNFAAPLAEVWKLGESITSFFSNPSGVMLDYVCEAHRHDASKACDEVERHADAHRRRRRRVVASVGKIAAVNGTTAQFETTAPGRSPQSPHGRRRPSMPPATDAPRTATCTCARSAAPRQRSGQDLRAPARTSTTTG